MARRPRCLLLFSLALPLLLAACPEPPPVAGVQAQGGSNLQPGGNLGNPPPPEGAGGGGANAGANPGANAGGNTGGNPSGAPMAIPGFASVIKDNKTITIRGSLKGASKGQVEFTVARKDKDGYIPFPLEIVQVTDGRFEITAPAGYQEPIYVSAIVDTKGDGPTPDDKGGMLPEPITIGDADLDIAIDIVDTPPEARKKLPWYRGDGIPSPSGPPDGGKPEAQSKTGAQGGNPPPGGQGPKDAPPPGAQPGKAPQ